MMKVIIIVSFIVVLTITVYISYRVVSVNNDTTFDIKKYLSYLKELIYNVPHVSDKMSSELADFQMKLSKISNDIKTQNDAINIVLANVNTQNEEQNRDMTNVNKNNIVQFSNINQLKNYVDNINIAEINNMIDNYQSKNDKVKNSITTLSKSLDDMDIYDAKQTNDLQTLKTALDQITARRNSSDLLLGQLQSSLNMFTADNKSISDSIDSLSKQINNYISTTNTNITAVTNVIREATRNANYAFLSTTNIVKIVDTRMTNSLFGDNIMDAFTPVDISTTNMHLPNQSDVKANVVIIPSFNSKYQNIYLPDPTLYTHMSVFFFRAHQNFMNQIIIKKENSTLSNDIKLNKTAAFVNMNSSSWAYLGMLSPV